jgi:DNA-binding NarL/FixJ family response regulator
VSTHGPEEERPPWRAVVVDYGPIERRGIAEALRGAGIVVVAEAMDCAEAVELVRFYEPDLVLVDVDAFGLDAIATTRRIRAQRPEQVVLLLASAGQENLALAGLRVGAAGYLSKDLSLRALTRAIVGVMQGEAAVSRATAMRLIEHMRAATSSTTPPLATQNALTKRQWHVLELLSEGRTIHDIAAELVLSPETVRSHMQQVLRKLGVRSREEAVAAAQRLRGLAP